LESSLEDDASAHTAEQSVPDNNISDRSSEDDPAVVVDGNDVNNAVSYGMSDEEFERWFASQLAQHPLLDEYPRIAQLAPKAVRAWRTRYRGNPQLWRRVFTVGRVIKELMEAAPILDTVLTILLLEQEEEDKQKYTIVDLASGKGYLSMFLSETLPPEKVEKIILVDKAWPMCGSEPLPHQMSWEHIYGNATVTGGDDGGISYFDTWPIPLHTSKQDLKAKGTRRRLKQVLFDKATKVMVLAVHLCGTLSLRAVEMFNDYPDKVTFLALKPCCLPPMVHAQRGDVFSIGPHTFDASEVCASGKFRKNAWYGPPRWHLEQRFHTWAHHLFTGIDLPPASSSSSSSLPQNTIHDPESPPPPPSFLEDTIEDDEHPSAGTKAIVRAEVQLKGGFQNTFVFAQRAPITSKVWADIIHQYPPPTNQSTQEEELK